MSHKGKATDPNVRYNPDDPPETYTNASVHSRLSDYTTAARELHGPDYDPATEDLDGKLVMQLGGGKQHGRYWMGNSVIDTASMPTLTQIKATDGSSSCRPRPSPSAPLVTALQAQLEEERAQRRAEQQLVQQQLAAVEAERELERQRMAELISYVSRLGGTQGLPLPQSLATPLQYPLTPPIRPPFPGVGTTPMTSVRGFQ